jgi:PAS domain S-box-containing protein
VKAVRTRRQSLARKLARDYLLISVLPLLVFFACIAAGGLLAQRHIADLINVSIDRLGVEAGNQLETIGRDKVRDKAREIARLVDIYLHVNPQLDIRDLQRSEKFRQIALQKFGADGYTCLYEAETGIMRVHPYEGLIDRDMRMLALRLPEWWRLFESSLDGSEISGYYDWPELNGELRGKFMTMTPVATPVQGRTLMVAATTYGDEFYAPIRFVRDKHTELGESYRGFIARQVWVLGSAITATLAVTVLVVFFLARRSARRFGRPVERLAESVRAFGAGRSWQAAEDDSMLRRADEIGVLARAFNRMRLEIGAQLAKLRESTANFDMVVENAPVPIFVQTAGRFRVLNPAAVKLFGAESPDQLVGQSVMERVHPDYHHEAIRRRHTLIELKKPIPEAERIYLKLDGTEVNAEVSAVPYRYEGEDGVFALARDVTERKRSERALRDSEARFRTAFENVSVGIHLGSLQGTFLEVNLAFCRMLGYAPGELVGRSVAELTHPEDQRGRLQFVQGLLDGKIASGEQERRLLHRDGSVVWALIWTTIQRDQGGRPLYLLSIVQDITTRKRASEEKEALERHLLQVQKMEAIGALAGGIAHDFNNILSGIIGYTELALMSAGAPAEYLQETMRAAMRARDLVKQILSFSRQTEEERAPVQAAMIVQEVARLLRATVPSTIVIQARISPQPITVFGNSVELHQILMNLCTNAIHAIGAEPGAIEIEAGPASITRAEKNGPLDLKPGPYVKIVVRDTGKGIPLEIQPRIFDPYFTTKATGSGTGLGLAVVHGIVKKYNGAIGLESAPGHGATFSIYLPQVALPVAAADRPPAIQGGAGSILLVDDEKMLTDVGEKTLARLGYQVAARTSPFEALELFKAKPYAFDLVITDQSMPGMTGDALAAELMRINPQVPVILCTGYSQNLDAAGAAAKGIRAFVMKPMVMSAIDQTIREVLGNRGTRGSGAPEPRSAA